MAIVNWTKEGIKVSRSFADDALAKLWFDKIKCNVSEASFKNNKNETVEEIKEEATMNTSISVFYLYDGIKKNTKVNSIDEAEALLARAKSKNVPAFYIDRTYRTNGVAINKTEETKQIAKDSTASIPTIDLWVDGACSNNGNANAKAGWGCILIFGEHHKELNGLVDGKQTNNRGELAAVINGLAAIKKHSVVLVHTDSQVVTRAPQIIKHGYRTADNKEAANKDLLEKLAELMTKHDVTIVKVEGHAGIELNEKCDSLARAAIAAAK